MSIAFPFFKQLLYNILIFIFRYDKMNAINKEWMYFMLESISTKKFGLTGNQLKIIASISMVLDHLGLVIFPGQIIFRILGRIGLPIYAFLIAEGCRHTRNRKKYLGLIAAMGIAFQLFYWFFMNDLYQGILITFSLSISLIFSMESFIKNKSIINRISMLIIISALLFIAVGCPIIFRQYGFVIDYGMWGILMPVLIYFIPNKKLRILFLIVFLLFMGYNSHFSHVDPLLNACVKWGSLFSIPFLALYNGERGRTKMKYFFYIFYPLHLVIIYAIAILISLLNR